MSSFAPLFSARVWPHAQVLLTGAILAPGKRTVSVLLRVLGLDHRSDFQTYHRVLNQHWTVETTFEEARAHLGMETQRQWNDQAIARTTPLGLALFAMVAILADTLHKKTACRVRRTAWYRKTKPTFADALAWVRKHIWHYFSTSRPPPDRQKPTAGILQRLIDIVSYAT